MCIILTAGGLGNVINNDTSVPTNPPDYNATANFQHLQSTIPQPILSELNVKKADPIPLPSTKDGHATNDSAEPNMIAPTTQSTTTSTQPTTTSTKPTTTLSTTTTTKSTTTSMPTTTAAPTTPAPTTPLPPPSIGKWTVKGNNTLCILVQMAVQFNVSYISDNVVSTQKLSSQYHM